MKQLTHCNVREQEEEEKEEEDDDNSSRSYPNNATNSVYISQLTQNVNEKILQEYFRKRLLIAEIKVMHFIVGFWSGFSFKVY